MPELLTTPPAELDVVYGIAVPDDAALMRQLRGGNWMDYVAGPLASDWMAGEVAKYCGPEGVETEAARIHSANTDPDSNFYFQTAKVNGDLAGYIAGFREHSEIPGAQEVAALHVVPVSIGRGIGSRLLERFFRDVGQNKPTALDVVAGTPAVGFYRARDFEEWPGHPAES